MFEQGSKGYGKEQGNSLRDAVEDTYTYVWESFHPVVCYRGI